MTTHTRELEAARRIAHVAPLATLGAKVAPPHTALLVIDMQNDFCSPGGLVSIAAYWQDDHRATLRNIDRFFGEVTTAPELERLWVDAQAAGSEAA